jgi:hypothetical protein
MRRVRGTAPTIVGPSPTVVDVSRSAARVDAGEQSTMAATAAEEPAAERNARRLRFG